MARSEGSNEGSPLGKADGKFPRLSMILGIYEGFMAHGSRQFAFDDGESFSYADVYMQANALAWFFKDELGLTASSTIALSAPNLLQIPVVLAAAQLVGARVALFASSAMPSELEDGFNLVKPQVVIMSQDEHCELAKTLVPDACVLAMGCPSARVPLLDEVMAKSGFDEGREFPDVNADSHIVVFSSGSTGAPKAIVNRASSFAFNGMALRRWLGLTEQDVVFLPVPLIHVFGVVGLYATLAAGASFVTTSHYHAAEACELISSTHATVHLGVPTMFIRELRENSDDEWDFSSLRAGLVAGAACPPEPIIEFEERFGCHIMQSYGMSETAATLTVTPLDAPVEERIATVGFCIEGAEATTDPATGEILCKTPALMAGLLQEDGSLDLKLDNDGWLHSGDIGVIDENGYITVTGRLKDMIIRGGVNVFPSEVEAIYEDNDDIAACCVVGYDDDELGERICLCVVMAPGIDTSARDLRTYAKLRADKCKVPDMVFKMEEFPYLESGKINKRAVKQLVDEHLAATRGVVREPEKR